MNNTLTFVALVPDLATRTRCLKMATIADQQGFKIHFWGWDRERIRTPGDGKGELCEQEVILLRGGGYSNRQLLPYYFLWVLRVFWQTLRHPPGTVQALGLESAFPVAVAGLFRRNIQLIFDDADRLSYCHSMPGLARKFLAMLERWTMRRSVANIIPGPARYPDGLDLTRTVILKNNPSKEAVNRSFEIETLPSSPDGVFTLLGLGWIGEIRGAGIMDAIAEHFEGDARVRIVAAGRLSGDAAERFVKRSNVEYLGLLSNEQALSLYRIADLVMTFYDPKIQINRYAEPNKWGDCIALGVPFIVNEEVLTAVPYVETGAAFSIPYGDTEVACQRIEQLIENPELIQAARTSVDLLQVEQTCFETVYQENILSRIAP